MDKLIRIQSPVVRIQPIVDGRIDGEYQLPFNGGTFDWPEGRYQVLEAPKFPFKVAVKAFYNAGMPKHLHVAGAGGSPMLKIRPMIKAPGAKEMSEVFRSEEASWLEIPAQTMGYRASRTAGPAKFAFLYIDKPELIEDFVNPPKNPGLLGVARLRYTDLAGKVRTHEVRIDDAKAVAPFLLPGSDLTVTFVEADQRTTDRPEFVQMLGDNELRVVKFNVRKGNGADVLHTGFAAQPMIPAVLGTEKGEKVDPPLLAIGYYRPPMLGGAGMMGNFGLIEVMGDPAGKLYYRVFGRDETPTPPGETKVAKPGVLKGTPGPLKLDEVVTAFGGNPNMPMTMTFAAEKYLVSAVEKEIYERIELPIGKRGDGMGVALLEMTVDGETKEIWVARPPGQEPHFEPVQFKNKAFQVALDSDRKDLGFSLKLVDFDFDFEPGTEQPTKFVSEVLLTDEAMGIKDKPITISMNHPLTHRQYTFYQSSYEPVIGENNRPTGDYRSVLQVGHDAGRFLKYFGCGFVVLGAFLQFTMRAGLFSDGGKREDAKAAEPARRILDRKGKPEPQFKTKPGKSKKSKHREDSIL